MDTFSIQISEIALSKIKEKVTNNIIRLGVKGGNCAGYSYIIIYDAIVSEDDKILQFADLKLVIDKKSALYLDGTFIDWQNTLTNSGFIFNNPNAASYCGCGASFSLRDK